MGLKSNRSHRPMMMCCPSMNTSSGMKRWFDDRHVLEANPSGDPAGNQEDLFCQKRALDLRRGDSAGPAFCRIRYRYGPSPPTQRRVRTRERLSVERAGSACDQDGNDAGGSLCASGQTGESHALERATMDGRGTQI